MVQSERFLDNFTCHVVLPYAKIKIAPKIHSTYYVTDKETFYVLLWVGVDWSENILCFYFCLRPNTKC